MFNIKMSLYMNLNCDFYVKNFFNFSFEVSSEFSVQMFLISSCMFLFAGSLNKKL